MRTCDKCQYGEVRAVDFYCSTAKTNIRRKLGLNDAPCEFFAKSEKPSFSQVALSKCHEVNPDNPQAVAESIPELLEACEAAYNFITNAETTQEQRQLVAGQLYEALAKTEGNRG